jgi:hypothetical protein
VSNLKPGDPYPGQTKGQDLRVDQAGNLRLADDTLIPDSTAICREILAISQYRKAIRTPAGHVIVRKDGVDRMEKEAWRFVGTVSTLPEKGPERVRYKVKSQAGRLQILAATRTKTGDQIFARGADKARNAESGRARDILLKWIESLEASGAPKISELYWDGDGTFWVESDGRAIKHPNRLAPLEFLQ